MAKRSVVRAESIFFSLKKMFKLKKTNSWSKKSSRIRSWLRSPLTKRRDSLWHRDDCLQNLTGIRTCWQRHLTASSRTHLKTTLESLRPPPSRLQWLKPLVVGNGCEHNSHWTSSWAMELVVRRAFGAFATIPNRTSSFIIMIILIFQQCHIRTLSPLFGYDTIRNCPDQSQKMLKKYTIIDDHDWRKYL